LKISEGYEIIILLEDFIKPVSMGKGFLMVSLLSPWKNVKKESHPW